MLVFTPVTLIAAASSPSSCTFELATVAANAEGEIEKEGEEEV